MKELTLYTFSTMIISGVIGVVIGYNVALKEITELQKDVIKLNMELQAK